MKTTKITILGSWSGRNKGDLAILRSILIQLQNTNKLLTVYIFSKDVNLLRKYLKDITKDSSNDIKIKILKSINVYFGPKTFHTLALCDKIIIGGGGLFFDTELFNPFFNHILNLFFIVVLLRIFRKPIMFREKFL